MIIEFNNNFTVNKYGKRITRKSIQIGSFPKEVIKRLPGLPKKGI